MSSATPSINVTTSNAGLNPIPLFNIGGIASGLDTNTIISQLMSIDQQPETLLLQRQAVEQARQNDLKTIQSQLQALADSVSALGDPATWQNTQSVSSSDPAHITAVGTGGAPPGGYQVSVTQLARAQQLMQGSSLQAANNNDQLTIQVGSGTAITVNVNAGDSLQTIANSINSTQGTPVYATVVNSKLVVSSQTTGAANTISFTSTGTLASDLGMTTSVTARDAQFNIDGTDYTRSSNIVSDAIAGLTLTLLGPTTSAATISVSSPAPDTSAIESKIQAFVATYNSTVTAIQSKLNEQKVTNPQSDADRAKGDLQGDSGLSNLLSTLRQSIGDVFAGHPAAMSLLSQAGLSTGAAVGSGTLDQDSINGMLQLDTSALESALSTNFSDVKAMFSNFTSNYSTEGLSQRLGNVLNTYTSATGIMASRIQSEQSLIDEYTQQKAEMDTRLAAKEASLRQMFTNMEVALGQAQAQGQQLSGQIANLPQGL